MADNDKRDPSTGAAEAEVETSHDGKHAAVSVPGTTGHHEPGERAAAARQSLSDDRLDAAQHVTAAVPRGDSEALDEVRRQLHTDDTRAAGATVMVEGTKQPPDTGEETR